MQKFFCFLPLREIRVEGQSTSVGERPPALVHARPGTGWRSEQDAPRPPLPFPELETGSLLELLERTKYGLRVAILVLRDEPVSFSGLISRIHTSQSTVIRCVRILEAAHVLASRFE